MTAPGNGTSTNIEQPALDVSYPLRIGKSVQSRRSRRPPREMLALKFQHVPSDTDMSQPGLISQPSPEKLSIQLPTKSNPNFQYQQFSGKRSALSDYVLVFVNGNFWLEKVSDNVPFLKSDGITDEPDGLSKPDVQMNPITEQRERQTDPDSWNAGDQSTSPVTPEDDDADDNDNLNNTNSNSNSNNNNNNNNNNNSNSNSNNNNTNNNNSNSNNNNNKNNRSNFNNRNNQNRAGLLRYDGPPSKQVNGRPPQRAMKMPTSERHQSQSQSKSSSLPRATAGKGLKTVPGGGDGNESPVADESIDQEVIDEILEVVEEDDEPDDNNNNSNIDNKDERASGSSSEDSDSDDSSSDSSSSNEEDDYTDNSTDEDD